MTVVASYCVGHAPGMVAWRERAKGPDADRLMAAYAETGARLAASDPEAVVLVTSEHFANFFAVRPPMYINVGDAAEGPAEQWLGVDRRTVPGHPALAIEMLEHSFASGFDIAHGHDLLLDHGSIVPLHLMSVDRSLPVVPVIVNGLVEPMPPLSRFADWGSSLARLFEHSDLRIALIGAGGLSHWPGMAEQGVLSEAWDRAIVDALAAGDRTVLSEMPETGRHEAGPGAEELRAWAVAGCATPTGKAEVLAYEAVQEWATGIAVVDMMPSGRSA